MLPDQRAAHLGRHTACVCVFNKHITKIELVLVNHSLILFWCEHTNTCTHTHAHTLQGLLVECCRSTRVRGHTAILPISAFRLNALWTKISTKWMWSATSNHHIPRYSLRIISSSCSVPFSGRSDEPREGIILGLCLFRSFSLQGTFYEQALMCIEYFS